MNLIDFLLVCAVAFVIGMMVGLISKPQKMNDTEPIVLNGCAVDSDELEKLNREYRNFLSYDGTEQK